MAGDATKFGGGGYFDGDHFLIWPATWRSDPRTGDATKYGEVGADVGGGIFRTFPKPWESSSEAQSPGNATKFGSTGIIADGQVRMLPQPWLDLLPEEAPD